MLNPESASTREWRRGSLIERLSVSQSPETSTIRVARQSVTSLPFCGRSITAFRLLIGEIHSNLVSGCLVDRHFSDKDAAMTDMCPDRHADMNAEPWEAAVAVRLPILLTGPDTATDPRIHQMERRLALPVIDVACIAG